MARALRIERPGGRYHVTARGNERKTNEMVSEDDAGWQEVARYVHLNPVRVGKLGLNKAGGFWVPPALKKFQNESNEKNTPVPLFSASDGLFDRQWRICNGRLAF